MCMREELESIRRALEAAPGGREGEPFQRHGVIVPLLDAPEGPRVLLEVRAGHLRRSPGEVGLPGGQVEDGESPWQAALREIDEELDVPAAEVELFGPLPARQRRRGELVLPFVCRLADPQRPRCKSDEVAELFQVPLSVLRRQGFRQAQIIEEHTLSAEFPRHLLVGGSWAVRLSRPVHYAQIEGRLIWGLTAAILMDLLRLTEPAPQGAAHG